MARGTAKKARKSPKPARSKPAPAKRADALKAGAKGAAKAPAKTRAKGAAVRGAAVAPKPTRKQAARAVAPPEAAPPDLPASEAPPEMTAGQAAEDSQAEAQAALDQAALAEAPPGRQRGRYATAEQMAKAQRSISVSEFFAKNRHLLGFDNPRKALLTTIKEAVDNALDACEEAGILPRVEIRIEQVSETHFRVSVQDNGPGIVRKQVPNIFGKLLYGSKFHRLRMSRGQQGIGISAAGMYGVLTTGVPVRITSRTGPRSAAHYYELQIDTRKNAPDVSKEEMVEWDPPHGTRVEIELEARYQRGRQSVDDYLQQTAIANPHVTLIYHAPDGRVEQYPASVEALPPSPKAIRPHPYGVELGVLLKMLADTKARTSQKFLTTEFSRISPRVAKEVLQKAGVPETARPCRLGNEAAKRIYRAIQDTRIMAPATDCVVPIGEAKLIAGLRQVVSAGFYAATTRSPAVYRGNPFIIEAAIAYGAPEAQSAPAKGGAASADAPPAGQDGQAAPAAPAPAPATDEEEETGGNGDQLAKLIRFANRVPLLYQQSACATYRSVVNLNWKSYGMAQSRSALPAGPLTVVVHMASVWVPFTSESKEAIAAYPEILKEIRLALQDCGRKLGAHIRKTVRHRQEMKKRSYIEKYIPAIGEALRDILDLKEGQVGRLCEDLKDVLERSRRF